MGRGIVERLQKGGFDVAFTYHSSREQAKELTNCLAIQADLTQPEPACGAIFDSVSKRFGRLDVLVNSASIYSPGDQKLKQMMAIHVESPLLLCRKFGPTLRKNRGHVINMVDLLAERPWPEYAAYCSSKAALWNLTLSLARDLAPEVTVNGIAPGVVEWPDDYPEAERQKYLQRVPLRRPGAPEDVANLVHFLATEGSYITGQIVRLDGGRSIT